jgi:hypothetical protein
VTGNTELDILRAENILAYMRLTPAKRELLMRLYAERWQATAPVAVVLRPRAAPTLPPLFQAGLAPAE